MCNINVWTCKVVPVFKQAPHHEGAIARVELKTAVRESWWSTSCSEHFIPQEKGPRYPVNETVSRPDSRSSPSGWGEGKSCPWWESYADRPALSQTQCWLSMCVCVFVCVLTGNETEDKYIYSSYVDWLLSYLITLSQLRRHSSFKYTAQRQYTHLSRVDKQMLNASPRNEWSWNCGQKQILERYVTFKLLPL